MSTPSKHPYKHNRILSFSPSPDPGWRAVYGQGDEKIIEPIAGWALIEEWESWLQDESEPNSGDFEAQYLERVVRPMALEDGYWVGPCSDTVNFVAVIAPGEDA